MPAPPAAAYDVLDAPPTETPMPDVDTDLPPELGMLAETLGFDDAKAKALKEFIRTCVRLDSETGPYDAGGDPGLDEEA